MEEILEQKQYLAFKQMRSWILEKFEISFFH
jgi:hypothetical protein